MRQDVHHAQEEAPQLHPEQKADAVRLVRQVGSIGRVALGPRTTRADRPESPARGALRNRDTDLPPAALRL